MKIAQINCIFPPYRGGMGTVTYLLAKYLAAAGDEVTVFTPNYGQKNLTSVNYKFKVRWLRPWFKYQNSAFIPQIFFYLNSFDVVHLQYPFFGVAEFVWLKKIFNRRLKLVLTYHQDSLVEKGFRKYIFKIYNKLFLPLIIKSADLVTCSSLDYLKNSNITKFYQKDNNKFIALPIGIDTDYFRPLPKNLDLLREFNFSPNDKIILFVGALSTTHPFKGVDLLIQASQKLKEKKYYFKVLIIGNGNLITQYNKLIATLKLTDTVKIKSGVADDLLREYYNLAYVSVLPSINKSEVFGLVLVEAMATGKPVISSDLPGVRTVVHDNEGGFLIKPGNVDDLTSKLELLLKDEAKAEEFGKNNLQIARKKYEIREIVKQLKNIYQNL